MSEFLTSLRERADQLKALSDGWGGNGSVAPDPASVDEAFAIGVTLADRFPNYPPQLVPCEDGSVQVEWHSGGWDVEVWVDRVAPSHTLPANEEKSD